MSMDPMQKPDLAPELAQLNRFAGEWAGRAEMIEPSYEVMQASMPEGEEMPKYFMGAESNEWTLGGRCLRTMGWHDMGEGQRANYEGMMTWDPKDKVYKAWWFGDWGDRMTSTMTLDKDGKTFHMKAEGVDGHGKKTKGEGTMTFLSDDTMEWTWSETGAMGRMKIKGTSKRAH
jgi:hypothetical protein